VSSTNRSVTWRPRPGWYAYRVATMAELPLWAAEFALTVERPVQPEPGGIAGQPHAVLALKAPARSLCLTGLAEAVAEVEVVAGARSVIRPRLLAGHGLPGLTPIAPAAALAHLGSAGARGLPPPVHRRQPALGQVELSWRSSFGSVLTCDGPCGTSAQAVVAVRGLGNVAALAPPPGGALVLRAWRARHAWGLACGLVLGAAEALGLGRDAGRVAARARAAGWQAAVLSGSAALHLARAGDPRHVAPEAAGHAASGPQVTALLEACLAAGDPDQPSAGSRWTLAVTP
jgi:hypothetical protein